jgi:hypothetical protein
LLPAPPEIFSSRVSKRGARRNNGADALLSRCRKTGMPFACAVTASISVGARNQMFSDALKGEREES